MLWKHRPISNTGYCQCSMHRLKGIYCIYISIYICNLTELGFSNPCQVSVQLFAIRYNSKAFHPEVHTMAVQTPRTMNSFVSLMQTRFSSQGYASPVWKKTKKFMGEKKKELYHAVKVWFKVYVTYLTQNLLGIQKKILVFYAACSIGQFQVYMKGCVHCRVKLS